MTDLPPHVDDEQQRIAELVRSFDAPAPESLHRRIESLVASHQDQRSARRTFRSRRLPPLGMAGVGAVVIAVVAIVIAMNPGGSTSLTLSPGQAAAPTLRAATLHAPSENTTHHAQLAVAVDGVPFPYWKDRFDWRSTGARSDRIGGRLVTTVFYTNSGGQRIGYAIVAGTPAPRVSGGKIVWRGGVPYRLLTSNGAAVVTWLRDGHLCVVSGHGVSSATLLRLASWNDSNATSS